jgi:hypothetical protein
MNDDVDAAIRERAAEGGLHRWLVELTESGTEDYRALAHEAVLRLHVEGEFDLLAILLGPVNSWGLGPDYEARTQLYANLIPSIETNAARLVGAIRAITETAWQHTLDEPYRRWCEARPTRPDEVLLLAGGDDQLEDRFLVPALIAGYKAEPARFMAIVVEIAQGRRRESQTGGLFAIGAMSLAEGADTRVALRALADLILAPETDGNLRATVLFAAVKVVAKAHDKHVDIAAEIAARVADDPTPEVVAQCAIAVASHGRNLPSDVRLLLASALRHVDATSAVALNPVDIALAQMLRLGDEQDALHHVQQILLSGSETATLGTLDSVGHELSHGSRERLGRLLASWLATGEPALCAAARDLVSQSGDQRLACDGALGDVGWSDELRVFVARKAIGWLMPHPTAPASVVVGLLRGAQDEAAVHLASLLLDPLLVNYPRAVKGYLERVVSCLPERAARWVGEALSAHAAYLEAIEGVGLIRELQPSRRHRRLEGRHRAAQTTAAMRKASMNSPLFSIMGHSTILYGTRTICRVTDFDGTERRLVNEMKSHETTMDRVMGLAYDALGLELTLFEMRVEAKPS